MNYFILFISLFLYIFVFFSQSYANKYINNKLYYEYKNNIKNIRKGLFSIKFVDEKKVPISDIDVKIEQLTSEFQFGGALPTPLFELTTHKREKEQLLHRANEMFNTVVDANGFKWKNIEKEKNEINYGIDRHKMSTKWARVHKKRLRHHTLFWSNPERLPDWTKSLTDAQFRQATFNRINYTKERLGNDISSLDVINEMLYFRVFRDRLGDSIIKEIFDKTKKAFPKSRLYLNEWPAQPEGQQLCIKNKDLSCFDNYIVLIGELQEKDIPFDGVGLQAHFDADGIVSAGINIETLIEELGKVIDNISKAASLPVLITEYDMKTRDDKIRADFLEAFYTMAFSNINVEGIIAWDWFDEHSQKALVKIDGSLTPAGNRYYDLVLKKWRTNNLLRTDDSGEILANVFYGDFAITLFIDTQPIKISITLGEKTQKNLTIELPNYNSR